MEELFPLHYVFLPVLFIAFHLCKDGCGVCFFSSSFFFFLNGKNNFSRFIRRQTNETVLCSFNFYKTTQ